MHTRLTRLTLALCSILFTLPAVVRAQPAMPNPPKAAPRTYVIVHGAWGGGWAFRRVEVLLRVRGQVRGFAAWHSASDATRHRW